MNSTVNEITKSSIGNFSLYESDTDELLQLTNQYPFFGPAQFLLAKKLKQENSPLLKKHIHKAALFCQNPVWFNFILNDHPVSRPQISSKTDKSFFHPLVEMETPATHEEVLDQSKTDRPTHNPDNDLTAKNQLELFIKFPKVRFDPVESNTKPVPAEENVASLPDTDNLEVNLPQYESTPCEQVLEITPAETPAKESDDEISSAQEKNEGLTHNENLPLETNELTGEESEDHKPLLVKFPKFTFEPIDPSKTDFTFEPYHTIDYFASQGIKNKEEDKPKDQLGRQLKSFTEWLKIMKRLPDAEKASTVSATDERNIEKMAEISINDREVVTEAMAQVWEKQGNYTKAIAIYQKLSLLNPSKTSYFAALIEQLKNL